MNPVGLILFLAIPIIALFDYVLFRRWLNCEHCGKKPHKLSFIVPTTLEIFCFIAGIYIGGL